MGDAFYQFIRMTWTPALWLTSRPILLHVDRIPSSGALILAPNHTSPFDVPCLMRSTPRKIDFLSIVEMERKRIVGPFYRAMNCVFIDRARKDLAAARALRMRLEKGRVVAMFPEGNIRAAEQSVTRGGAFKPGVVKLAQQAGVPIYPCVLINSGAHLQALNWLPFQRWSYGLNFGEPIRVSAGENGVAEAIEAMKKAYISLSAELEAALKADTSARGKTPDR